MRLRSGTATCLGRLLRWASKSGQAALAGWLIACGAPVNGADADSLPLLIAAAHGRASVLRVLLRHGADINARDAAGWTALMHAAHRGDLASVQILLAAGADIRTCGHSGETALDLARSARRSEVVAVLEAAFG